MPDKRRQVVVKIARQRQTPRGKPLDPQKTRESARKVTAAYVKTRRKIPRPRPWHTPRY